MGSGGDGSVVALVLAAVSGVLAAPVAGSVGHPLLADGLVVGASLCGVGAFALAARQSFVRARNHSHCQPLHTRSARKDSRC